MWNKTINGYLKRVLCMLSFMWRLCLRFFVRLRLCFHFPVRSHCLLVLILSLITALCTSAPVAAAGWYPHALIVFGDGSSDTGNSYIRYKIPRQAPYWNRRFSNGPVWSEELAYLYGLIPNPATHPNYKRDRLFYNISYYDASMTGKYLHWPKYRFSFNDEINELKKRPYAYPYSALVIVFLGRYDIGTQSCLAASLQCFGDIIHAEVAGITRLYAMGYRHFVIANPGRLDLQPFVLMSLGQHSPKLKLLRSLQDSYDRQYATVQKEIQEQHADATVLLIDTKRFNTEEYARYPKEISSTPCYNNFHNGMPYYDRSLGDVCKDPDQHYYYDTVL